MARKKSNKIIYLVIFSIGLLAIITVATIWGLNNNKPVPPAAVSPLQKQERNVDVETQSKPIVKAVADETLGSGLVLTIPADWVHTHTGAQDPTSTTEMQTDENKIVSPSGKIMVVMRVDTNAQIGGTCSNDYIKLKLLQSDTLPKFPDGRYAAYVVYYPRTNFYQYHIGLQKNNEAIRGVSLTSNTACNFMYSEFLDRKSSIPGVPQLLITLDVQLTDVAKNRDLNPGVTEQDVANRLSGAEYDQAKQIVQSLYLR